jgi:KaiC/GvpD/RAD55 family RecA-like ATPase
VSLPVEVPGLDTLLSEIGDGTIVIVEGGADLAKSFFVRRLCRTALHAGRSVAFVTSRDARELREMFARENGESSTVSGGVRIVERDAIDNLSEFVPEGGLLAVDSFSFLTLGLAPTDLARMLRDLHRVSRENGATTLLATDQGMLDPRAEAVVTHLAEGHIEFHAQEGTEGLIRFLRIPKWADGRFVDRNIYYDFDGRRMAIDLRSRVL